MHPTTTLAETPTTSSPADTPATSSQADGFFPSGRFAKVPAEALGPLAQKGPHRMSHAEFRLTAHSLQAKGWVRIHHEEDHKQKRVENYELLIPTPGASPGVAPKARKPRTKRTATVATVTAVPTRNGPMVASRPMPAHLLPVDCAAFDAMDDEALYTGNLDIDSEPMTAEELERALSMLEVEEA